MPKIISRAAAIGQPTLSFPDQNLDSILDPIELLDLSDPSILDIGVWLPGDISVGDTVTVSDGTVIQVFTVSSSDISSGRSVDFDLPAHGIPTTFTAFVTNGIGVDSAVTSQTITVNLNEPPTTNPYLTGNPTSGEVLTVHTEHLTDPNGLGPFSYQWIAAGTPIAGATSSSYTLTDNEIGKQVWVEVSYVDGIGVYETIESKKTAYSVLAGPGLPLIRYEYGKTLSVDLSKVNDGLDYDAVTFQWYRDGNKIPGATASTYQVVAADEDARLTVEITYNGKTVSSPEYDPFLLFPDGNSAPLVLYTLPLMPVFAGTTDFSGANDFRVFDVEGDSIKFSLSAFENDTLPSWLSADSTTGDIKAIVPNDPTMVGVYR